MPRTTTEEKRDFVQTLQKWIITIGLIAGMVTGISAFTMRYFVTPEIERTAQSAAKIESDKTRAYCVERYLEMAQTVQDIKDGQKEIIRLLINKKFK